MKEDTNIESECFEYINKGSKIKKVILDNQDTFWRFKLLSKLENLESLRLHFAELHPDSCINLDLLKSITTCIIMVEI